ncbi:NAD(P)/FAD-dependent oxidoreductase [Halovivax limisalsi]|uniref:NAD(P)/FAD-dependent oxidoreductase n=1 Tax=Halovivax limisalsi TaxID=1453760 RepID=UPI001FFD8D48|nr:FAD-dependent oxidoreductase [Halovivax limisalsi]
MPSDVDVAIVGGGVVGTSIAYHLADRDAIDVALFERDQLGSGTTSKAAGGVRNVFSHPMQIAAGTRNLAFYRRFGEETGVELDVAETGYLYLVHDEAERREWADRRDQLRTHDVETRLIDADAVAERFPPIDPEAVEGGFFAPECLHLDPYTATQGFATAARERGATIETGTPVESVTVDDGSVTSVTTSRGTVEAEYVINAAGPWGVELAASVGLDLPITRSARRIAVTESVTDAASPLVIDRDSRCYFRTEANGSMLCCDLDGDVEDVDDPTAVQGSGVDLDYQFDALSKVSELVPAVEDVGVVNGWTGVQTHTPDGHPILGPTEIDGFVLASGFNGLGVMLAPTIGRAFAERIVDGSTDAIDLDRLGPDRFDRPPADRIEPERLA